MNNISVILLTFNEDIHLERCISSLKKITNNIFVVDSYSGDNTIKILESFNVSYAQRAWKNYADQFQWGLDNSPFDTEWVMRMDADEYVEQDLIEELPKALNNVSETTIGFYIRRKYYFLGKWVKHGAVYPLSLLRVWRKGCGRIENRWMDEHIVLDGDGGTTELLGHIVDDNLNNTRWWTDKHNKYADREMIDILDKKYQLFHSDDSLKSNSDSSQAKLKRLVKEGVYNKLPIFIRPLVYFLYRYFIRLGFLDGTSGFAFHFFQGYWYRSLVDLRVYEAERVMSGATSNEERINRLEKLTGLQLQ